MDTCCCGDTASRRMGVCIATRASHFQISLGRMCAATETRHGDQLGQLVEVEDVCVAVQQVSGECTRRLRLCLVTGQRDAVAA